MTAFTQDYQITWEKLPDDYRLSDDPVHNINQPALALEIIVAATISKFGVKGVV